MGSTLSCLGRGSGVATKEQEAFERESHQLSQPGLGDASRNKQVPDTLPFDWPADLPADGFLFKSINEGGPTKNPRAHSDSTTKQAQPAPDSVPIKLANGSGARLEAPSGSEMSEESAIPVCPAALEGCCPRLDEGQQQVTGKPWDYKTLGVPDPPNSQDRSDTGEAMGLPPASQSAELNLIMRTICRVFEAPHATMALYFHRSVWCINSCNWPLGTWPWTVTACPWNCLVTQPQVIACGELQEDARFHHQPWVDSGLRCYVSAPVLASNGHRMGTVCFLDTVPRRVDAGMCRVLGNFGEIAIRVLERHIGLAQRLAAAQQPVPHQLHTLMEAAYTGRDVRSLGMPGSDKLRGLDEGHWDAGTADDMAMTTTGEIAAGESAGPQATAASPPAPLAPGAAAEPLPADVLLSSVFARQLRSSEVLKDACTLVVDTGVAGWTVMYADETWKLWSGFSRNELLGRPLQALLSPATPGVAPLNWAALQREVEGGERFVVPGVVASAPQGMSSTQTQPLSRQRQQLQQQQSQQQPYEGVQSFVAEANAVAHQPGQPRPRVWQSPDMPHDMDMRPSRNSPGVSAVVDKVEMEATVYSAVLEPDSVTDTTQLSAAQTIQSVEDLLYAVAQQESGADRVGQQYPGLAAADAPAAGDTPSDNSGVELWHEAAGGPPPLTRGNTFCSTPAVSTSNITNCTPASAMANAMTTSMTLASSPPGALPGSRVFDLSFRPLALDVLDEDALPLGIPSWVPLEACAPMLRLYAVRLHATMAAAQPPQPLTPSVKLTSARSSTRQQLAAHLFPGLGMGQVLGRGGYGTAYTGTWHDVSVVVKVQDHQLDGMEWLRTAQVEVALGQMLRHPHLVRTLAHGAAEVAPSAAPAPSAPRFLDMSGQAPLGSWSGLAGGNVTSPCAPHSQMALLPPQMPVDSDFSLLSKWLSEAEHDWDGYGANSWFSHCSQDDMMRCTLLMSNRAPETSAIVAQLLPPPINFINAVAVAPDVVPPPATTTTSAHAALPPDAKGSEGADDSSSVGPSGFMISSGSAAMHPINRGRDEDGAVVKGKGRDGDGDAAVSADSVAEGSHSGPIHRVPPAWGMGSTCNISYLPVTGAPAPTEAVAAAPRTVGGGGGGGDLLTTSGVPMSGGYEGRREGPEPPSSTLAAAGTSRGGSNSSLSNFNALYRVSTEMASLMESGQRHATHVGAKPMQFPMHLRTFAILEYCDGGTLQDAVDRGWLRKGSIHVDSPIDLSKVVTLASHVACAAAYLHERGVVHADLSAANVLLCSKRPMVSAGQNALLTAADLTTTTTTDTPTTDNQGTPTLGYQATALSGSNSSWCNEDASTRQAQLERLTRPLSSTTNATNSNTSTSAGEELLYTLPTKRYSLAPSKARSADDFEFVAKVSDFGKSCLLGPEGVTKAGGYATVTHMAPEVLREHLLSPAADVYALGVLMWQMYTCARPWAGMTHRQVYSTVISGRVELEWPDKIATSLPLEHRPVAVRLVALGRSCLAHHAAARPTMATVERELTDLAAQLADHQRENSSAK